MTQQTFGKYTVVRTLGKGGMASVYEARDPLLDRRVAIKIMHPHLADDPGFGERFTQEARLVAGLRHPNLVRLYDFDIIANQAFMVMEYLDGGTLKDRLVDLHSRRLRFTFGETSRILQALASGLHYAHNQGAVHRDIKPANILFTPQNDPVITDFGIAKLLDQSMQFSLTGSVIGTPAYMAPEQAAGQPVDSRSDQYSLAIMIYEMVTGRVPFVGDSATAILMQHLSNTPPPPRTFNPNLPEAAQVVLLRALARQPGDRFPSILAFAEAFEAALRGVSLPAAPAAGTGIPSAATLVEPSPAAAQRTGAPGATQAGGFTAPQLPPARTPPPAAGRTVAPPLHTTVPPASQPQPVRKLPLGRLFGIGFGVILLGALAVFISLGGLSLFTPQPPTTPSGYVVAVADFDGSQASVRADFGRRIYDQLESELTGLDAGITVIRTNAVYADSQAALSAGQQLGAAMLIWGWYDDLGVSPRIELIKPLAAVPQSTFGSLFTGAARSAPLESAPGAQVDLSNFVNFIRTPRTVTDLDLFVANGSEQLTYIAEAVLGLAFQSQGDLTNAIELYDRAIALVPSAELEALGSGAAQSPGLDLVFFQRGHSLSQLARYPEAVADLERAAAANPALFEAHYNLAVLYPELCTPARRLDDALAAAQAAVALQPDDPAAQRLLAGLYSQTAQPDAALAAAQAALALDASDPQTHLLLGDLYHAAGQESNAAAAYAAALELLEAGGEPQTAAAALALGDAYLHTGDLVSAAQAYARAAGLAPDDPEVYRSQGNLAMYQEDYLAAVAAYQEWLERAPEDAAALNALGLAQLRNGDLRAAQSTLESAAASGACNATAYLLLGGLFIQADDYAQAEAAYSKVVEIEPANAHAFYFLGSAQYFQDKFDLAQVSYSQALALQPDLVEARGARGSVYYRQENYQPALEDWTIAAAAFPDDPYYYISSGNAYEKLGELDSAITAYRLALDIQDQPDPRVYLGFIYAQRGEYDLAAAEFERALELKPGDFLAASGLAEARLQTGDLSGAAAAYEIVLDSQDSAATRGSLGLVYTRLGQLPEAIAEFEASVQLDPASLPSLSLLAGLYSRTGQLTQAEQTYQQILALDENRPDVYAGLGALAYKRCEMPAMIQNYASAAELGGGSPVYFALPGAVMAARGDTAGQSQLVEDLLAAFPQDPLARLLAAEMTLALGDLPQAQADLQAVLTAGGVAPVFASIAHYDLGVIYLEQGDLLQAKFEAAEAYLAYAYNAAAHALAGDIALRQDDHAAALAAYDTALALLPEYGAWISGDSAELLAASLPARRALALSGLGETAQAQVAADDARQRIETLLDELPNWSQAQFTAGVIYYLLGDPAAAETYFSAAAACDLSFAALAERTKPSLDLLLN